MQNTTPDKRLCQAPVGTNGTPEDWNRQPDTTNKQFPELEKIQTGLTTSDLNTIVADVGGKPISKNTISQKSSPSITKNDEVCLSYRLGTVRPESLAETKKITDTFSKNMESYPKPLSYEGSVVLCSLIGLKQNNNFRLAGLPKVDQDLIYSQLPSPETLHGSLSFSVELDDQQDFKLKCEEVTRSNSPQVFNLRFFNSVVRPNVSPSDISVEQDGNKVTVGTNLVLDQQRIQKLVGNAPPEKIKTEAEETPRRQAVAGRNAFEIRSDMVSMAMDLLFHNNKTNEVPPEKVISTARILYSFVENKR